MAISTRFPGLTLTEPLPLQVTPALKAQVMFVLTHDDGEVQRRNVIVPVTFTLLLQRMLVKVPVIFSICSRVSSLPLLVVPRLKNWLAATFVPPLLQLVFVRRRNRRASHRSSPASQAIDQDRPKITLCCCSRHAGPQRSEARAHVLCQELGLLPGRKVPTFVVLLEVE